MIQQSGLYKINSPHVVGEVFDDEAVVVNLKSGIYYSLNSSGKLIWKSLEGGITVKGCEELISNSYIQPDLSTVTSFLEQLHTEGLIAVVDSDKGGSTETYSNNSASEFEAPSFEKFSDMQDLLLLDPIHEVDETGWPKKKEE